MSKRFQETEYFNTFSKNEIPAYPFPKSKTSKTNQVSVSSPTLLTELCVRKVLHKVLKFPMLLIQLGGYFPYLLTSNNNLRVNFPLVALMTGQFTLHFLCIIYFFMFQVSVKTLFGQFSETEEITAISFGMFTLLGQATIRLAVYYNHARYIQYQSLLNKLFCALICQNVSPVLNYSLAQKKYVDWIEKVKRRVNRQCFVILTTIMFTLAFFFIPVFVYAPNRNFSKVLSLTFGFLTMDFLMAMFLFHGLVIWLSSYVDLKATAVRIIRHKVELISEQTNCQKLISNFRDLMNRAQEVEELFTRFNKYTAVYFITWFVFMVLTVVHQAYQTWLWIRYKFYHNVFATAPTLVSGSATMYFICTVASKATLEVTFHWSLLFILKNIFGSKIVICFVKGKKTIERLRYQALETKHANRHKFSGEEIDEFDYLMEKVS